MSRQKLAFTKIFSIVFQIKGFRHDEICGGSMRLVKMISISF